MTAAGLAGVHISAIFLDDGGVLNDNERRAADAIIGDLRELPSLLDRR